MSSANISVQFSALLSAVSGNVTVGSVLCKAADGTGYVVATAGNLGTAKPRGLAITSGLAGTSVVMQSVGDCDASLTGLGAGLESYLNVNSEGRLQRCAITDPNVIGWCDSLGDAVLSFGTGAGSTTTTTADDVARSGATGDPIDRVQGLRGVTLQAGTVPVGGSYVRNAVGGSSFKAKKSASPGMFDVHDYGAVGDGTTDDLPAFQAAMAAILAEGTYVYSGAILQLNNHKTYKLSDNLVITQGIDLSGPHTGINFNNNATCRLSFAAGKGIWVRGVQDLSTQPQANGARIGGFALDCTAVAGVTAYAHSTAYASGALVYLPHSHEFIYQALNGGTSGARPVGTTVWAASTAYNVGDQVISPSTDGHIYVCQTATGTRKSGATAPTFSFIFQETTTDNELTWMCDGDPVAASNATGSSSYFNTWPDQAMRPHTVATDPSVVWTAGHTYAYNDVVRMPGITAVVFIMETQGGFAVSRVAGSTPLTNPGIGNTVSDGTITWTALDAASWLKNDNGIIWQARCHPGIHVATQCFLQDIFISNTTNFSVQLQANDTGPFLNADGWQMERICSNVHNGFIRVRGNDGNAGYAESCQMRGVTGAIVNGAKEWDVGFKDTTSTGSTWVACMAEFAGGAGFISATAGSGATFIGCYSESNTPNICKTGVVVGGALGGSGTFSRDSFAPVLRPGGSKNISGIDTTNQDTTGTVECYLADQPNTIGAPMRGRMAFAIRCPAESQVQGFTWSTALTDGSPAGWWYWAYHPSSYNTVFSSFAVSGPTSALLRGSGTLTNGAPGAEFMFPQEGYFLGGIGTNTIHRHQNVLLVTGTPTLPTSGTWVAGDLLWNTVHNTTDAMGIAQWVCTTGGSHGAWGEVPVRLVAAVTTTNNSATSLLQTDGTEIVLPDTASFALRITVLGSRTDAGNRVREVHEVLAHTTGGTLTIDDDDTVSTSTFPAGWAIAISAVATRKLRIQCTGNTAQTVKWKATVEITTLAGN